jgi:Dyp-type peroxidase family
MSGADLPFLRGNAISFVDDAAHHLSGQAGRERMVNLFQLMQRGLVYPAPYARFVSLWVRELEAVPRARIAALVEEVRALIHRECPSSNTTAVVAVSFALYRSWSAADGGSLPKGMDYLFPAEGEHGPTSAVFARSNGAFQDTGQALWFHLKSDESGNLERVNLWLRERLADVITDEVTQECESRVTRTSKAGKVLGCRFSENLNNPVDPVTIAHHTLVGYEDVDHAGGSFVLAQRFHLNWNQLHNLSEEQIEDIIGRTTDDRILPTKDTRTHINSARQRDAHGSTMFVMRLGLPFGQAKPTRGLKAKGASSIDEEGIYFAGYARSVQVFETIMNRQIGEEPGFMNDRLFDNARSDLGGLFYVPSRADLGLAVEPWSGRPTMSWRQFPGVDWQRLSRHFEDRSANGLMFYNHKNYLFEMSAGDGFRPGPGPVELKPPSTRILALLLDSFTRWQDTWYFPKGQPEMGHLCAYVAEAFGPEEAARVMTLSIAERRAWAIRMTCRLYASEGYGYRGYDWDRDQEGADTFRLHPWELIAGAMPNLSLGQGRYVMAYLREDERMPSFLRGLSEASAVGHIIPDHEKLVTLGIGGLLAEIEQRAAAAADGHEREFYASCQIALFGVQDHLRAYSGLARARAAQLGVAQVAERDNLAQLGDRLEHLVEGRPRTMLEATQLIFTMHSCLHFHGEVVAIGRLDQILDPFYRDDLESGRISEDEAQEIIDAFWIKLDEKVLQNRLYMHDHQPFGNLAMGGTSGPYPQGASLGQWIQQVTVGGVKATDDEQAELAYNGVTRSCLRAAARLPLNAPCLSLRVREDMPKDLFELAATAILSGGAHPILLHDDKIVAGMRACGDGVGGEALAGESFWRSEVSLRSARNYACDGCYEPMFVGQNWFTLGGFSTLDPLECALNQGRLYASAGPAFLRGQDHSLRTKPPGEIESFEELLELYFEHFYLLVAKALDGQLASFDALVDVCPSPLLSTLIDDCLAKGRDLYGGGARYNIYGPCFTALSSTIDSLYCIKKMVFDRESAVTSLEDLVDCLSCDWGHKLVEPFVSSLIGDTRRAAFAERWKRLREVALSYPRYGQGDSELDALGDLVVRRIAETTVRVFRDPLPATAAKMRAYAERYGTDEHPFGFQIQPGAGTFENFVAFGGGSGASADGRRLGEAIASDLSPSPSPMDREPDRSDRKPLQTMMAGYAGEGAAAIWQGAPTDFNIAEDFPFAELVTVLEDFAAGNGSNILTITCASPETFDAASSDPERYDLLRVRMGGWSEFFTAMFPESQEQHRRRRLAASEPRGQG